jgi:hypothetical protein
MILLHYTFCHYLGWVCIICFVLLIIWCVANLDEVDFGSDETIRRTRNLTKTHD